MSEPGFGKILEINEMDLTIFETWKIYPNLGSDNFPNQSIHKTAMFMEY
jgi:hypothetical protein